VIPCRDGKHTLRNVYIDCWTDLERRVVRWCTYCGAIVVDVEYDGRTRPGGFLPMEFPVVTRELVTL
jgi:hypothetical protein